mgnify:FL=1
MKSNKNFQKSKKHRPFDEDNEIRAKKVGLPEKKSKNLKKEIFEEIDEFEEIDLFGNNEDYEDYEDSDDEELFDGDDDDDSDN